MTKVMEKERTETLSEEEGDIPFTSPSCEPVTVYTKPIVGTMFKNQEQYGSVIEFYDNYTPSSIEGQVEQKLDGEKPTPDYIKQKQDYIVIGKLNSGLRAKEDNLKYNSALFFDIEPPKPKKGGRWESLELDEALHIIQENLGEINYIVHNTINSQEHFARLRLIVPTDRGMSEREYELAWDLLVEQELKALPIDRSSRDYYRIQGAPINNGLGTDILEPNNTGLYLNVDALVKAQETVLKKREEEKTKKVKKAQPVKVTTIDPDDFEKAMKLIAKVDVDNLVQEEHYFKWILILANGVKNNEITEKMAYMGSDYISLGDIEWQRKNSNRLSNELKKIDQGTLKPSNYTVRDKINAVIGKHPDNPLKQVKWYSYDDTGNADRFIHLHGHHIRFNYESKNWYFYNGKIWEPDFLGRIPQYADDVPDYIEKEGIHASADDDEEIIEGAIKDLKKHIKNTRSNYGKNSFINQSQHRVPIKLDQFDNVGNKLNIQNGYLDLDEGKFFSHDKEKLFTLIGGATFNKEAKAPKWNRFINETFLGDVELIDYVQRAIGYTLTNSTGERQLFFLWGNGSNGKSVFINVIEELMGSYTQNINPESIMVSRADGGEATPAIAKLKGARFVSSSESKELGRLDESLVKRLTGGDTITARFLNQNEFLYRPQFKLWVATNHKPQVKGDDPAIWGRIVLIPFLNEVKGEAVNKKLTDELKEELSGILNWALEGYKKYKEMGLRASEPEIIKQQRSSYKEEMDIVGEFLKERCVTGKEYKVQSSTLYKAYCTWCSEMNIKPESKQAFSPEIERKGFDKKRESSGQVFLGINIKIKNV